MRRYFIKILAGLNCGKDETDFWKVVYTEEMEIWQEIGPNTFHLFGSPHRPYLPLHLLF